MPPLDRNNNFDLVRLAAALQVALLHSTGHLEAALPIRGFLEHFPGVPIFFFISGLMVTASACRRDLRDYAGARFRRIYPALFLAFAMTLVMLSAFGQVGPAEIRDPVFWAWAAGQLTLVQVFNPEMFRDFGVGAVNGSLWTIPVEVGFYMILPVLLFIARGRRGWATALFAIGVLVSFPIGYALELDHEAGIAKFLYVTPLAHFWLFGLGGLTYLHWDRIKPVVDRVHWALPVVAYLAFIFVQPDGIVGAAIGSVMLCAAVLWLGTGAPVVVGILRGNDISYGLYLYHMLAVNALLVLGFMGWPGVVVALALSIAVALLSWRYVERIVLRRGRRSSPTLGQPAR
jgi:peptidoglycan/LPS O-acetylase OafA/YrhL